MSLTSKELLDLFVEASKLMSKETDRCGNLVYTQKKNEKNIIREPEATYVIAELVSKMNITFGLEVPTKQYLFHGKTEDVGNTDIAIEPNKKKQINIELKRDQPAPKKLKETIGKDFVKLLGEKVYGCAFFHILKNIDSDSLKKLLKRYNETYFDSLNSVNEYFPKWFLLFIYVKENKQCYWQLFDDITNIQENDFELNRLLRKKIL